jgi:hypothetical protein
LGIWEESIIQILIPGIRGIKSQAGLTGSYFQLNMVENKFKGISPISRYGGTYAHKDIALYKFKIC